MNGNVLIIVLTGAIAISPLLANSAPDHTHEPSYPTRTDLGVTLVSSGSIAVNPLCGAVFDWRSAAD
jgi:hypothetical protein